MVHSDSTLPGVMAAHPYYDKFTVPVVVVQVLSVRLGGECAGRCCKLRLAIGDAGRTACELEGAERSPGGGRVDACRLSEACWISVGEPLPVELDFSRRAVFALGAPGGAEHVAFAVVERGRQVAAASLTCRATAADGGEAIASEVRTLQLVRCGAVVGRLQVRLHRGAVRKESLRTCLAASAAHAVGGTFVADLAFTSGVLADAPKEAEQVVLGVRDSGAPARTRQSWSSVWHAAKLRCTSVVVASERRLLSLSGRWRP